MHRSNCGYCRRSRLLLRGLYTTRDWGLPYVLNWAGQFVFACATAPAAPWLCLCQCSVWGGKEGLHWGAVHAQGEWEGLSLVLVGFWIPRHFVTPMFSLRAAVLALLPVVRLPGGSGGLLMAAVACLRWPEESCRRRPA
jgi:hypothetical protein